MNGVCRTSWHRSLVVLWALGASGLGCSAIVSTSDDDIRCAVVMGVDPCPEGRRCIDSYCRPPATPVDAGTDSNLPDTSGCVPNDTPELCNSVDDDCDGNVDEGHDLDGDGATWCGGGRGQQYTDCDDSNPNVRPDDPVAGVTPGTEECNGIDEDCDGTIDEGAICRGAGEMCFTDGCFHPDDCRRAMNGCGPTEYCDTDLSPPTCQLGGCTTDGDCDLPTEVCDTNTRDCVRLVGLGEACATDTQCGNAVCIDRDAANLGNEAPSMFCAHACCTDTDCPAASICWNSGTGSKLCIAEDLLGLTRGPGGDGAPCSAGSDCASSLCAITSGGTRCLGNCSESRQCSSSGTCQNIAIDLDGTDVTLNACLGPIGTGDTGSACSSHSQCAYGLCFAVGDATPAEGACSGSCGQSTDCNDPRLYCGYVDGVSGFTDVPICLPKNHSGSGTGGSACVEPNDCNDRGCVEGRCLDSCCQDSQCAGASSCRPYPAGGTSYRMRCSP